MTEITLKIDGMMCGMCESHVNDAVRRAFNVKKVTSSHKKGETVIVTKEKIDVPKLKNIICETGYQVLSVEEKTVEKKGIFGFFK
jgi:copper chaperone CopZ